MNGMKVIPLILVWAYKIGLMIRRNIGWFITFYRNKLDFT